MNLTTMKRNEEEETGRGMQRAGKGKGSEGKEKEG